MFNHGLMHKYIFVAMSLWLFMFWAAFNHQSPIMDFGGDFWEHAAVLQTWMGNLLSPPSPHVMSDEGSSRYMPFYFLISLCGQIFELSSLQAMGLASIVSITILMIGIPYFTIPYYKDKRAPLFTIIILFCGWGVTWNWSNAYQLKNLTSIAGYPSFFVFSFSFLIFGLIVRFIQNKNKKNVALSLSLISILIAIAFLSHPLTGIFTVFFAILLGLFHGEILFKERLYLVLSIAVGSFIVEFWPYFSTWSVILGKTPDQAVSWISANSIELARWKKLYWGHPFYSPIQLFMTFLPALVGLALVVFYRHSSKKIELILAFMSMFFVYAVNLLFAVPLGHRALLLGVFPLHLYLVGSLLQLYQSEQKIFTVSSKLVVSYYLVTLVIVNILITTFNLNGYNILPSLEVKKQLFSNDSSVISKYAPIVKELNASSVVMVNPLLGWALPSMKGKVVIGMHTNPLIKDRTQRSKDVKAFFNKETSKQQKELLLKKYAVTHVLFYSTDIDPILFQLNGEYQTIGEFILVKLKAD